MTDDPGKSPTGDDSEQLKALARDLPTPDVDQATAARIAAVARRGPPVRRKLEVMFATLVAASLLVWAAIAVWRALK